MTQPINTTAIEKATHKSWAAWVRELDAAGAQQLSHADLAKLVNAKLAGMESAGWWAQGITVAYEQHMGKRVPGQLANGLFELAVSKTVALSRVELFVRICEWCDAQADFDGHAPLKARTSETPKRSNWRCDFSDGSKFAATVEAAGDKAKLVLTHTAVPTKQEADAWKVYWKGVADGFAR